MNSYPVGSFTDSRAPYNEPDPVYKKVTLISTILRTVDVLADCDGNIDRGSLEKEFKYFERKMSELESDESIIIDDITYIIED